MWLSPVITPDPLEILWHFATGYRPDFLDEAHEHVGWIRFPHRGVHAMSQLEFPSKHRRLIDSPGFEFRIDTRFEEVVRACGDVTRPAIQKRGGKTWIIEPLIRGVVELNRMGFAHSFELWQEGKLVAGVWAVHLGGYVHTASIFTLVSNAGKIAIGRTLRHLKERGFEFVDRANVPDHSLKWGVEWWPRWKFEALIPQLLAKPVAISDDRPAPEVPMGIRLGVPAVRAYRAVRKRVFGEDK